jgi:shikimate dehydrogenase
VQHLEATKPHSVTVSHLPFDESSLIRAASASDLIVNTTSVGMRHSPQENESPLPIACLRPGLWVADVVYNPLETVLLRQARAAGAHAVDGLGMLVYQGVAQQLLWTDREPPGDIMREAALAAMAARE